MLKILFISIVLLLSFESVKAQTAEGLCTVPKIGAVVNSVLTAFKTNGDLCLDVIPKYAQYLKNNKIFDILISAYIGEGPSMNVCDRIELIRAWVKAATPLGLRVMVQITGGLPVNDTLTLAELCVELKVKAIVVLPETVYTPQTIDEAIADLQLIAKVAVGIPIIYEDIRALESVGVVSSVDIFKSAKAQIPCFAGIITSINTALNIRAATCIDDKLIIIPGSEAISSALQLKFNASVNSITNLFPGLVIRIIAAIQAGNFALADRLQAEFNLKAAAVIGDGDLAKRVKARAYGVNQKVALTLISGLKIAIVRPPLQPARKKVVTQIANALKKLGVKLIGTVASVFEGC